MIRVCLPNKLEELRARPLVIDGDGGDDDLGKHVERVLHDARRLHIARPHASADRQRLRGVVTKRRHEDAATHCLQRVARAPHPLQRRRDPLRTLQLQHQIDRPDVDAQLQ